MLKHAVKNFLARKLDDLSILKRWTTASLNAAHAKLPATVPLWNKLRHHQRVGVLAGIQYRRIAFWYDMGTGKTMMSIVLMRYFRRIKTVKRVLVLVPNNINRYEWRREIRKHSPKTSYVVLAGSSAHKWELLRNSNAFLTIATYAGLVHMVCERVPKRRGRGEEMQPVPVLLREIADRFDGLLLDESTAVGGRKLAWRICRQISKRAQAVFALSGTPFGRDPTPLWAQMYLVDHGASLGPNLGIFRAAFFTSKVNYWSGWPEYTFDKRKRKILNRVLSHRSLQYEADAADLPRVVSITKTVRLPQDARTYYEEAKKSLIMAKGNYRTCKNAFMRMRQISSGFLGYYDDDVGAKAQIEFPKNPKLELLLSLVESSYQSDKILILHDFVFSGSMISRELERMKIGHARVYGRMKDKAQDMLRRFDEDDDCRVFVINTAGAFGLNLQRARFALFYESPPSPILRKQMERRNERQESPHRKIFRYDLIVEGTADAQIRQFHREGQDMFEQIMRRGPSVVW